MARPDWSKVSHCDVASIPRMRWARIMKLIVTVLAVLFGLCSEARAQSAVTGTRGLEFAAAVNQIQRDARGEGLLLVPDGVKDIRGVIVISPREGLGFDVLQDSQWERLARELQFGLVSATIRHISSPPASSIGPGRTPDATAQVLEMLLTELADSRVIRRWRESPSCCGGKKEDSSHGLLHNCRSRRSASWITTAQGLWTWRCSGGSRC